MTRGVPAREAAEPVTKRAAEPVTKRAAELATREGVALPPYFRPPLQYPEMPYDRFLAKTAERHPERLAVVHGDSNLSYRELEALANGLARALLRLGVAKGDRIALLTPNCVDYVIAFYAIARVGAIASPMNPSYREREVEYQLRDTEAVALVVHGSLLELAAAVAAKAPSLRHVIAVGPRPESLGVAIHVQDLIAAEPPLPPPPAGVTGDDLVALPYSSGTTGLPKGVMLSHRNLVTNNVQFLACLRLGPEDRLLVFLPFYHIYGTMLMGGAVAAGAALILMERFDLERSLALVARYHVTHYFAVPPVLLALAAAAERGGHDLSSLRLIMVGAAPVAPEVARRCQELLGVPVVQGYGMTEASPLTHLNPVHDLALNVLDSAGLPAHDTEHRIVDIETDTRVLGPGETGEVAIRGPQIMQGYWRAPEATAAVLQGGWYLSGDIGAIDERGYLYVRDRKKEMIKFKGFGVAPAEIEAVLLEHPAVADAGVVGRPDAEAGEVPTAFVVLRPDAAPVAPEALVGFVRERLASYKTPGEVAFIDAIPRNPSGKILRRVLKERVAATPSP